MKAIKKYAYFSFFGGDYEHIVNSDLYDTLEEAEKAMDEFQERFPTIKQVIIMPVYLRPDFIG